MNFHYMGKTKINESILPFNLIGDSVDFGSDFENIAWPGYLKLK